MTALWRVGALGTVHLKVDVWWWGLAAVVGKPLNGAMGPMVILQLGPAIATYYVRDQFAPPVEDEVESAHGPRAESPAVSAPRR